MSNEEVDLIEKKLWSSKQLWSALIGVAFVVFTLTMIYAKFLGMGKDIEYLKASHATEMQILESRQAKQNERHVKEMEDLKLEINTIQDKQVLIEMATMANTDLSHHEKGR